MLGSAEYLRELVSFDERRVREMEKEEVSSSNATGNSDERNMENEVEAGSGYVESKDKRCGFFDCWGWQ